MGVDKGVYLPVTRSGSRLRISFDTSSSWPLTKTSVCSNCQRSRLQNTPYVARLTNTRLHQPVFRPRVLRAYGERCAIYRLHHPELLDAAHIIPDGEPAGEPIVPNGLSLCKIHHAAYDSDLIGVRPDLVVDVRPELLLESDGPMLRHGLQEMSGVRLTVPTSRVARPDPDRLEIRYERFKAAS